MHYRSIADLNETVYRNLGRLPSDIDLIVGIPRSGLLAANVISLALNVPLAELEGFMSGRVIASGNTRRYAKLDRGITKGQRVLVVDDSLRTGNAIRQAAEQLAPFARDFEFLFCVAYGVRLNEPGVDVVLEAVPQPRVFQWNLFHHVFLESSCVALEGVILPPIAADQESYSAAADLTDSDLRRVIVPTKPVGHLISLRHPRHRPQIEQRLRQLGIKYHHLHFRQPQEADDGSCFKSTVFASQRDAILMIEPSDDDAVRIVRNTGKPTLSLQSQEVFSEATVSAAEFRIREAGARRLVRQNIEADIIQGRFRGELKRILQRLRVTA
jgi:hypoxanthine phosphoribosyltransferase